MPPMLDLRRREVLVRSIKFASWSTVVHEAYQRGGRIPPEPDAAQETAGTIDLRVRRMMGD